MVASGDSGAPAVVSGGERVGELPGGEVKPAAGLVWFGVGWRKGLDESRDGGDHGGRRCRSFRPGEARRRRGRATRRPARVGVSGACGGGAWGRASAARGGIPVVACGDGMGGGAR